MLSGENSPKDQRHRPGRELKKGKRARSGDTSPSILSTGAHKKKKLVKSKSHVMSSSNLSDTEDEEEDLENTELDSEIIQHDGDGEIDTKSNSARPSLPAETPDWRIKLLEIMQLEFKNVTESIKTVDSGRLHNTWSIKKVEKRLAKVELKNKTLESENIQLKEKLLDIEYRQRRNNLLFEGIVDALNESDLDCIAKVRSVLKNIPGIMVKDFRIDRCYRLDGPFRHLTGIMMFSVS